MRLIRLREEIRGIILRVRKKKNLIPLSEEIEKEANEALDNYLKEEADREEKEINEAWKQYEDKKIREEEKLRAEEEAEERMGEFLYDGEP